MKIYDDGSMLLHEILGRATSNATLLIPDLQRPYVWSPGQVTLLIDSLLRGWPFGTLLLWSIDKNELAGIPSRPFWRVVDRTNDPSAVQVSKRHPPAEFQMVLDGQQRLQSLLLAFGGEDCGFKLPDQEWSIALERERPRGRNAKHHWSLGHMCLDVQLLREKVKESKSIAGVDFRDVLPWVVQDPQAGRSSGSRATNYKFPIASALDVENKGRFIRLSRLWEIASTQAGLFEKDYRRMVEGELKRHDVPECVIGDVLQPMGELVATLVNIKQSKVSFLKLLPFDDRVFDPDVYHDAIVNIFTRLNTAGRALTRQEITFAWIKTGWDPDKAGKLTATQCFEKLKEQLADEDVEIDMDALVGMVSTMWSVLRQQGDLLTAADLLRGEKVKPMAQELVGLWETLTTNVLDGAHDVADRGFKFGVHYRSLNALTLLLAWRMVGAYWMALRPLSTTDGDDFQKSLDATFNDRCDRWIAMSQWSGRWSRSTERVLAEYTKDLAKCWSEVEAITSPEEVIGRLSACMDGWLKALLAESQKYIEDLLVPTRQRVHEYFLPLWLWHRFNAERWDASQVPLRIPRKGDPKLEVDHVVAIDLWSKLPRVAVVSDNDADDQEAARNALGNCSLLEKAFNISKSAKTLKTFLSNIYEFQPGGAYTVSKWAKALDLDPTLVDPTEGTATRVSELVEARTLRMKEELRQFLAGDMQRADVSDARA